jgi:predicted XRE-type DNA-binding protein
VSDERLDQLPQVALVQDDDVIEKFSAYGFDKSLRDPILPRALVAGARWFHEHRPDRRRQPCREDGIAIDDQKARRRLGGKGLAQLLRHPGRSRREKSQMKKGTDHEVSGENVFKDLDVPSADEGLTNAELAARIAEVIARMKLTQAAAGEILGADQPTVSALLREASRASPSTGS